MSKELVTLANRLDSLGFTKEANLVDALLKKKASDEMGDQMSENLITLKSLISGIAGMIDAARAIGAPNPLYEGNSGKELVISLERVAGKAGVTPDEAMNMLKEELASFKSRPEESEPEIETSDEPPIDHEVLKKTYKDFTKKMIPDLESLEVNELYWTTDPATGSFYVVRAEGTWDDGAPLNIDSEIWPVKESYGRFTMTLEGDDGKTYYLYTEY